MKSSRYMPVLFAAVLLLGLLGVSCAPEPVEVTPEPVEVEIEYDQSVGPITLEGKVLHSYRVDYEKSLSKEDVSEMAKRLTDLSEEPLDFEELLEMEDGLIALRNGKDPSAIFEMDTRSGNFLYNGGLAEYKLEGSTPDLITGEEAAITALQHLEELGLLPNAQELSLVDIGGLSMAVLREDNTTEVFQKLVTVHYRRELSDIPVMGESRIVVHMGANGELAGLVYYWGEIVDERRIESDKVLSDEEIERELESRIRAAAADAKGIVVQKTDFVLYDDGKGQIEPAYYVRARFFYESSEGKGAEEIQNYDIPYDYYIPVLKEPLAFYPYMETAEIEPTDARELEIAPEDNE